MKHTDLTETPFPAASYSYAAEKYVELNSARCKDQGEYVADMDNFKIVKFKNTYSVWDNDAVVACSTLNLVDQKAILDDVWTRAEYRNQKLFSKMIWFYLTRLNIEKLFLAGAHSEIMRNVLNSSKNLPKVWVNAKTGEERKFDPNTSADYYQPPFDEWELAFSAVGFKDYPMFNSNSSFTKESYEGNI